MSSPFYLNLTMLYLKYGLWTRILVYTKYARHKVNETSVLVENCLLNV